MIEAPAQRRADPANPAPRRWAPGGDAQRQAARVLWIGRVLITVISLMLLGLLGRVAQLQGWPEPRVVARLGMPGSELTLAARRGTVTDRRGRPLATTRVAQRLFVDPRLIVDRNTFSERVAHHLGYDPITLEKAMAARPGSRYIVLDDRLSDAQLARVREADLPGLATEPVLVRDYPQGELAGQVVGFVGAEGRGLDGMERRLNEPLGAEPGALSLLRDARRRMLWAEPGAYRPQADGQPVRLTLDMVIQTEAEAALTEAVETYGAASGQLVVMDPATGELLAIANVPRFDPALAADTDAALRRNRAVTDVFEPGSIFKPFVWAALTEMRLARPKEVLDTTTSGVYRTTGGRRLRDARPHGRITWDQVLVQSSNIGMAIVAERTTTDCLHGWVRAFGFGEPTGSGLPGELPGLVRPLRQWNHYSQTSIPMGQEIGVTAVQMVRAFSVFANDGLMVTPTIFPTDTATRPVIQQRVLTPAVASYTRDVLRRVVEREQGHPAHSTLYNIFGKTGTAQLPDLERGGYFQDRYVSSFLAGAPVEAPRLIVGCFIQDPDRDVGHFGGVVAGPAVKRVIEAVLPYLGVPPASDGDAGAAILTRGR